MIQTAEQDGILHTFKSDNDFLWIKEWISTTKSQEVHDKWVKLDEEKDVSNPEYFNLYEEWKEFYKIEHTSTPI